MHQTDESHAAGTLISPSEAEARLWESWEQKKIRCETEKYKCFCRILNLLTTADYMKAVIEVKVVTATKWNVS